MAATLVNFGVHLVHISDIFCYSKAIATVSQEQTYRWPYIWTSGAKNIFISRFSRSLNNCKVPQIRYATPERLLQRLTDLRFLSIDFLNTFLLTYRVFTDGVQVLEALKKVFFDPDTPSSPVSSCGSVDDHEEPVTGTGSVLHSLHVTGASRRISTCSGYSTGPEHALMSLSRQGSNNSPSRRISAASSASGYYR